MKTIIAILLLFPLIVSGQAVEHRTLEWNSERDSVIIREPVYITGCVTMTCIIIEPPKSLKMLIVMPIDELKQKSSPRLGLRAKIGVFIATSTATYMVGKGLCNWVSIKF